MNNTTLRLLAGTLLTSILFLFAACGPTVNQVKPQPTVTIDAAFQAKVSPVPTIPPYRCGAWASNYSPSAYSTITIYARLTKNASGVADAFASATVHFKSGDTTLDQRPKSDQGGYVSFTLPIQGRQPRQTPATVDITFTVGQTTVACSPTFFTPQ
jgi:hypothetical protein